MVEQTGTGEAPELLREQRLMRLVEATTVLLSDQPTKPVDAVFFHGRSFLMQKKKAFLQLLLV